MRKALVLIVLLLVGILLAGCGSSPNIIETVVPTAEPTVETTTPTGLSRMAEVRVVLNDGEGSSVELSTREWPMYKKLERADDGQCMWWLEDDDSFNNWLMGVYEEHPYIQFIEEAEKMFADPTPTLMYQLVGYAEKGECDEMSRFEDFFTIYVENPHTLPSVNFIIEEDMLNLFYIDENGESLFIPLNKFIEVQEE